MHVSMQVHVQTCDLSWKYKNVWVCMHVCMQCVFVHVWCGVCVCMQVCAHVRECVFYGHFKAELFPALMTLYRVCEKKKLMHIGLYAVTWHPARNLSILWPFVHFHREYISQNNHFWFRGWLNHSDMVLFSSYNYNSEHTHTHTHNYKRKRTPAVQTLLDRERKSSSYRQCHVTAPLTSTVMWRLYSTKKPHSLQFHL